MRNAVVFEAVREGYGIDQLNRPMTVGELREILDQYEDDTLFVLSHDNGYTYGSVSENDYRDATEDEDGEWQISEEW